MANKATKTEETDVIEMDGGAPTQPKVPEQLTLTLPTPQIDYLLNLLSDAPFKLANPIINTIREQAQAQIK